MYGEAVVDKVVCGPRACEPRIVSVKPDADFRVILEYETGERKRFDVEPYIRGDFLGKLAEKAYFEQVRVVDGGTAVGWPNGQDIGPEDLYELSEPVG